MKTLNENWFTITLFSVIFGILGFLIGRSTGHNGPKGMPHMMMGHGVMDKAMFISDDGEIHDLMGDIDMDVVENIEVIKGDDGEITVTIDSLGTGNPEAKVRVIKVKKD
jgi:hypothetical protein